MGCRFDRYRLTKELRRSEGHYDTGHKVTGLWKAEKGRALLFMPGAYT